MYKKLSFCCMFYIFLKIYFIHIVSFAFQTFPNECVCFSEHWKKYKNSQEHEHKQLHYSCTLIGFLSYFYYLFFKKMSIVRN